MTDQHADFEANDDYKTGPKATPNEELRRRIARAIHRYDNHHALSGNDIPSKHHLGEADFVLAELRAELGALAALRAVSRGYCPHCGRGDAAPTAGDWEQQRDRAEQSERERDEARQHSAAIAAQRDRLRQRMNTLADRWDNALAPDKAYARALRAEISFAPFHDTSTAVQAYRADDGNQKWAARCWGTDTCDGWLGLGHETQSSAKVEQERHVAEAHVEPGPAAAQATEPRERCGDVKPQFSESTDRTECVLRPGHTGSHADHNNTRWWWTDPQHTAPWTPPPPGDRREQLPDHLLALLDIPPYTSTACETVGLLTTATTRHPEHADELQQWAEWQRQRCRLNNKYTGAICQHTTKEP